jgi:hypothetical protein
MYYMNSREYDACRETLVVLAQWNPEKEDLQLDGYSLTKVEKKKVIDEGLVQKVVEKVIKDLNILPTFVNESLYAIKGHGYEADFMNIQAHFKRLQVIAKAWKESQSSLQALLNKVETIEQNMFGLKKWVTKPTGFADLSKAIKTINDAKNIPESGALTQQIHVGPHMEIITETIIHKDNLENRAYHVYERPSQFNYFGMNKDEESKTSTIYHLTITKNPVSYKKASDSKDYISEKTIYARDLQNHTFMDVSISSRKKTDQISMDIVDQVIRETKPALVSHWNYHELRWLNQDNKYIVDKIKRPDPFLSQVKPS